MRPNKKHLRAPHGAPTQPRRWKAWSFRLICVFLFPALLLLAIEGGLRLFGYGRSMDFAISHRINGQRMIVSNPYFTDQFFGPRLARDCRPFALTTEKPPEVFRVFVVGGSAAMGIPEPSFNIGRLLETMLRDQYPGLKFEVVNVAITASNSHVALPVARDCARLDPDLFIIYMGNNEVVGPHGAGTVFTPQTSSLFSIRMGITLNRFRMGQLLGALANRLQSPQEEDRRGWRGMQMFVDHQVRASSPRLARVYRNFEANLTNICRVARRSGAKTIISTVGVNLRDCAPFSSLHQPGLKNKQRREWEDLYSNGLELEKQGRFEEAIKSYLQAEAIDATFAELQFRLGRCRWALQEFDAAKNRYVLARELDALRFRADTRINEIIRRVAGSNAEQGIYLADAAAALDARSPHATPGKEFFYEHVHPTFSANYLIARSLIEQVHHAAPDWMSRRATGRPVLSEEEVARSIAYTGWDKFVIADHALSIIAPPPFNNQSNHDEQVAELERLRTELEPSTRDQGARDALTLFEAALARDDSHWSVRLRYAFFQGGALKDHEKAEAQWRMLLDEHPLYWEFHFGLAVVLAKQRKYEEAVSHLERTIELRPYFEDAHLTMGNVLLNAHPDDPQTRERAMSYYRNAIDLNPGRKRNLKSLASVYLEQAKRSSEAGDDQATRQLLGQALEVYPDYAQAHYTLGAMLHQQGDEDGAVRHYLQVLRTEPNHPGARYNLALIYYERAEFLADKPRIDLLREVVKVNPDFVQAHYVLGRTLRRQGDIKGAVKHYSEVLRISPDNQEVRDILKDLSGP